MSDLLNQASLVYIPSGYKEDTAYSVIPTDGSGDLTFSRASDGTRVNSSGYVENVPWNLLQQSNTFSNAAWNKYGAGTGSAASVTSGFADPNGGTNAWRLQCNLNGGTTSSDRSYLSQGGLSGTAFSASKSLWIKNNTASAVTIFVGINSVFDSVTIAASADWQRIKIEGGTINNEFRIGTMGGASLSNSVDIIIYGAQLNQGSTAKPYFPTTNRQDVPRLDYSGGCPSLLLEPQRTNLLTYSENLNAVFVPTNITQTANYGTSPDGNLTSTRLELDNLTNSRTVETFTGIVSSGVTYTFSCYYKGINGETTYMYFLDSNGITSVAKKITFTGEWQRESITFVAGTASNYTYIVDVRQGTSTATDFEVWGAQVEAGSYPTSYIPTTSASVTRVADSAYKTGISSLIGQTEGVIFVEGTIAALDSSTNRRLVSISDGSTLNQIQIFNRSGTEYLESDCNVSGASQWSIQSGSVGYGTTFKTAVAYKANDIAFYVNGSLIGTDTTANIPATSQLAFSRGDLVFLHEGKINQAVLFKTRLTNAELAALTTL